MFKLTATIALLFVATQAIELTERREGQKSRALNSEEWAAARAEREAAQAAKEAERAARIEARQSADAPKAEFRREERQRPSETPAAPEGLAAGDHVWDHHDHEEHDHALPEGSLLASHDDHHL